MKKGIHEKIEIKFENKVSENLKPELVVSCNEIGYKEVAEFDTPYQRDIIKDRVRTKLWHLFTDIFDTDFLLQGKGDNEKNK